MRGYEPLEKSPDKVTSEASRSRRCAVLACQRRSAPSLVFGRRYNQRSVHLHEAFFMARSGGALEAPMTLDPAGPCEYEGLKGP